MRVIYIAGPFRGAHAWAVAQNVRRAEELAFAGCQLGAAVLCPHANTAHFDGTLTDDYWLAATLELLRRCDAVLLVPGWEKSSGTRGEVAEAKRLGMPVFEDVFEVREWLAGQ